MIDIAMHAAGAAINEAPDPGLDRGVGHGAHPPHVDFIIEGVRHVHLAEGRRQMVDGVHPGHRPLDNGGVRHGPDDHLSARLAQLAGLQAFLVVQGNDGMAFP
jgi:hypothetical protein